MGHTFVTAEAYGHVRFPQAIERRALWMAEDVAGASKSYVGRSRGYADKRREDAARRSRLALSISASARCWAASRLSARVVDAPIAS